jgi:hypothetical protein
MEHLFKFEKAIDWQIEDDQYELIENPDYTIQVSGISDDFVCHHWDEKTQSQQMLKTFRTLAAAMRFIIKVADKNG